MAKKKAAKKAARKKADVKRGRPQMGRPTDCTPELTEELCGYLRAGNYIETAAHLAGVWPRRVFGWVKRGQSDPDSPYAAFAQAVKRAEADAEQESINRIRLAGRSNVWQADAWYLERKAPQRWGKQERAPDESHRDADKIIEAMNDRETRRLLDEAARRLAMAGEPGSDSDETE